MSLQVVLPTSGINGRKSHHLWYCELGANQQFSHLYVLLAYLLLVH